MSERLQPAARPTVMHDEPSGDATDIQVFGQNAPFGVNALLEGLCPEDSDECLEEQKDILALLNEYIEEEDGPGIFEEDVLELLASGTALGGLDYQGELKTSVTDFEEEPTGASTGLLREGRDSSIPWSTGSSFKEYPQDSLLDSLSRLGGLDYRVTAPLQSFTPHEEPALAHTPTPTISLGFTDGLAYPTTRTVMESDPYGMVLNIRTSDAPQATSVLTLQIDGTALMASPGGTDGDYAHWKNWTIETPAGSISASQCMVEVGSAVYSLSLPTGITDFNIRVPLVDNVLSNPDRSFTYTVVNAGEYEVENGQTDTIIIVDDSRVQDLVPGWTPPTPGDPAAPNAGNQWGPTAQLLVYDGTDWTNTHTVAENDSAPVQYRFQLVDTHTGAPYTPGEDITVTIVVYGQNGMDISSDFDLSSIVSQFATAGAGNVSYANGVLTFTLPQGWTPLTPDGIDFTATPIADYAVEARADGSNENLFLAVGSAEGNEALRGSGVETQVQDIPTVSVAVATANSTAAATADIFESSGSAQISNEATFTFTLTSPSPDMSLQVNIEWNLLTGGISADDFEYSLNGGGFTSASSLPPFIEFANGSTSVTITVRAKEDSDTEGLEKLSVSLKPQNGTTDQVTDNYHVSGSNATAEVTLLDDTSTIYGESGAYLDGPQVLIVACDVNGEPQFNGDGTYRTSIGILEKQDNVYFRPVLSNADGTPYAPPLTQDIAVTFTISANDANTFFASSSTFSGTDDFYFNFGGNTKYSATQILNGSTVTGYTVTLTLAEADYLNGTNAAYILGGKIHADAVPDEVGEGFSIAVTNTVGQEASPGAGLSAEFLDAPVVSVRADAGYVSESGEAMTFTLTVKGELDGTSTERTIWLKVTGDGGSAIANEIDLSSLPSSDGVVDVDHVELSGIHYIKVTVPAKASGDYTFTVPFVDDALTEDDQAFTLTLVPPNGGSASPTDSYRVTTDSSTSSGTTVLVDDTTVWADELPTEAGNTPAGHGVLEGPRVALVYCSDAQGTIITGTDGKPITENSVLERSTGDVYFKVMLLDSAGNVYTGTTQQDITVTIDVLGYGDALFKGNDLDFAFTDVTDPTKPKVLYEPDAQNYHHGKLIVEIAEGTNGTVFQGKTNPDTNSETNERFDLAITDVFGNEASVDTQNGLKTTIIDTPTVSITTPKLGYHSESADVADTFTVTVELSSVSTEDTVVTLRWSADTGNATPGVDFGAPENFSAFDPVTKTYTSTVTIPAGETSASVSYPLKDNALTHTSNKTIQVELGPASSDADATTHAYHVDNSHKSATGTIVDDTANWSTAEEAGAAPGVHASLDGPLVKLILVNSVTGSPLTDTEAARIMENGGTIGYKIVLVTRADDSAPYTSDEAINVTLKLDGTATLTGANSDYVFDFAKLPAGSTYEAKLDDKTISITIPRNCNSAMFTGTAQKDSSAEAIKVNGTYTQEFVKVEIDSVSNNEASKHGSQTSTTVTIVDVPVVSIESSVKYYSESGRPADPDVSGDTGAPSQMEFTINLSGPPEADLVLELQLGGTGTPGVDYTLPAGFENYNSGTGTCTIKIPAGQDSLTFTIEILDDKWTENNSGSNETVNITIKDQSSPPTGGPNYYSDSNNGNNKAEVVIVDDTSPWPADAAADNQAPGWHNAGSSMDDRNDGPLVVIRATVGNENVVGSPRYDDANADPDNLDLRYDGDDRNPIVLEADGGGSITYHVELVDRADDTQPFTLDQDVTITLDISSITGSGANYGNSAATGGDYYLDVDALMLKYGNPPYNASFDQTDGNKLTITIPHTVPQNEQYIDLTVKIVPDKLTEIGRDGYINGVANPNAAIPDEGFVISVIGVDGNEASPHPDKGSIETLIDEKHEGITVGIIAVDTENVREGSNAKFTLELTSIANEDVIVILQPVLSDGTASVQDFDAKTLQVTIEQGQIKKDIDVKVWNDILGEGVEKFTIKILHVSGGEVQINPSRPSASCSIVDDMNGPVVSVAVSPSVGETDSAVEVTLTLDPPSGYPDNGVPVEDMEVTLKFAGSGGDPVELADFDFTLTKIKVISPDYDPDDPTTHVEVLSTNPGTGEIVVKVPAGFDNVAGLTISVPVNDDDLTEDMETFTVSVEDVKRSEGTPAATGSGKEASGVIVDDTYGVNTGVYDPDTKMDGPVVKIRGTEFISESGDSNGDDAYAVYEVYIDPAYVTTQDIVVTVKYLPAGNNDYDAATPLDDFEILSYTMTIPAGNTVSDTLRVRVPDNPLSEDKNSRFEVIIEKVEGNEALMPPVGVGDDRVQTVIVDDTQPWTYDPHDGETVITYDHGSLDGPVINLSGAGSVREDVIKVKYEFTMDKAPVQEVTVTMKLAKGDAEWEDFFGPQPGNKTLEEHAKDTLNQANNNDPAITNARFGSDGNLLFDFVIPKYHAYNSLYLPIFDDDLTESGGETYTLSIATLDGSEAVINGTGAVTTRVDDENQGPMVYITCYDPDLNNASMLPGGGSWTRDSDIVSDSTHQKYDPETFVQFRVNINEVAQEELKVYVVLRTINNEIIRELRLDADDPRVEMWPDGQGGEYPVYEVVISSGEKEAFLNIPKKAISDPDDVNKFMDEHYQAWVVKTIGCESQIPSGSNFAEVEIDGYNEPVPWTHMTIKSLDRGAANDPQNLGDSGAYVKEGEVATFLLTVSGSTTHGHTIDQKDNTSQAEVADNLTDYDITVTLIIDSIRGVDQDDFDLDDATLQKLKDANPDLKNFIWDDTTNKLSFVIEKGTNYTGGIEFKLPITEDSDKEGTEYYNIRLGSASPHISVNNTPLEMGILDKFDGPELTLLHYVNNDASDADTANITEIVGGTQKEFCLVMTEQMTSGFTVNLEYTNGDPDGAKSGQDYFATPTSVHFSNGTSGWTPITINGQTYYRSPPFSVSIPDDQLSEGDHDFYLKISGVSDGAITVTKIDGTPVDFNDLDYLGLQTVIEDDYLSGPLVYFSQTAQDVFEADGDVSFTITLSAKAVEDVKVTFTVQGQLEAEDIKDFSISLQVDQPCYDNPNMIYRGSSGGVHTFELTVPTGTLQIPLTLKDFLEDDPFSEDPAKEKIQLTITNVEGGEARIMDGSGPNNGGSTNASKQTVTVYDSPNGPSVSISGTTSIDEEHGRRNNDGTEATAAAPVPNENEIPSTDPSRASGIATYTVSLGTNEHGLIHADEDITVTIRVARVGSSRVDGLDADWSAEEITQGYKDIDLTIAKNSNSATWTMDTLINNNYAETANSYTVSIVEVEGNEASIGSDVSVTTTVNDNDFAPVPNPENVIVMVPLSPSSDITVNLDVLTNDTDADDLAPLQDPHDKLKTLEVLAANGEKSYGTYSINTNGNLTYTVDKDNPTVAKFTNGESATEDPFFYTVTDGDNQAAGRVNMQIKAGNTLTVGTANANEWIFGTGEADIIDGRNGADIIDAGGGNDIIYDYGNANAKLIGGAGDDTFMVSGVDDTIKLDQFSTLEGGTGLDFIKVNGNGKTVDLSIANAGKLNSIEMIDISGNNLIVLNKAGVDVFKGQMGQGDTTDGIPMITGTVGDRFEFAETGWHAVAGTNPDYPDYCLYTNSDNSSSVWVHKDLAQVVNGDATGDDTLTASTDTDATGNYALYGMGGNDTLTGGAGNDQLYGGDGNDILDGGAGTGTGTLDQLDGGDGNDELVLHDTTGDGFITAADFWRAEGGKGKDTLRLSHDNASIFKDADGKNVGVVLDFSRLPGTGTNTGKISSIETIDLHGDGDGTLHNGIVLTDTAFADLARTLDDDAQGILRITGQAGDTYELTGDTWEFSRKTTDTDGTWFVYTSTVNENAEGKELWVNATLTRQITGTTEAETLDLRDNLENMLIDTGDGHDTITGGHGNEIIYGGAGDDTLRGGAGTNVLHGGAGNDTLYNDSASDTLYGDDGDDAFILAGHGDATIDDSGFTAIHGGTGLDTISISGSGITLDLNSINTTQLSGIETFNITGNGNNHIILAGAMLEHLSDPISLAVSGQAQIRIVGNTGDTFELQDSGWAYVGRVANNGSADTNGPWQVYTYNGKTVWVSSAMQRIQTGDGSNNSFVLSDVTSDAVINGNDFSNITGGAGRDTVTLNGGGLRLDLAGMTPADLAAKLSGIEIIDITGTTANANHIVLNAALAGIKDSDATEPLHIDGKAGDTFSFVFGQNWYLAGTQNDSDYYIYTDGTATLKVSKDLKPAYEGTSGPDTLTILDLNGDNCIDATDFANIKGEGNQDTVKLASGGLTLDLRNFSSTSQISGLEVIDLSSTGAANTLILDAAALTAMNPGSPLKVHGDAGDLFNLHGNGWTMLSGTETAGDKTYFVYENSGKTVWVQDTLARQMTSSGAGDVFTLYDTVGTGNVVTGADFVSITGGSGTGDTVRAGGNGLVFDFSALATNQIQGIETISFGASGVFAPTSNNHLILGENTLSFMGFASGGKLIVTGGTDSTFELTGSDWSFKALSGSDMVYKDKYGREVQFSAGMKRVFTGSDNVDDTFVLNEVTGGGIIDSSDFKSIKGGTGTDTITLEGSGLTFKCIGMPEEVVSGVEIVNLGGNANKIQLDFAALKSMGLDSGEVFTLNGDATNAVELYGEWSSTTSNVPAGYYRYACTVDGQTFYVDIQGSVRRAYRGTEEADTFVLEDVTDDQVVSVADFSEVHGGDGENTIRVGGTNLTLDLTQSGTSVSFVETIDLSGSNGENLLILNGTSLDSMLAGLSPGTAITVTGDPGDAFLFGSGLTYVKTENGMHVYNSSNQEVLRVDADMKRAYQPGNGDSVALDDLSGDGVISGADFKSIVGAGSNTLTLSSVTGNGKTLDLTDLADNQISGVTTVNLSGNGANTLLLDTDSLGKMGFAADGVLLVSGDSGDALTLKGEWAYHGVENGKLRYVDNSGRYVDIDTNLALVLQGPDGDNTFTLGDPNGNGTITANEIPAMSDNETLVVDGTNTLDLTGLTDSNQLSGVSTIRCSGTDTRVILNSASVAALGGDIILEGGASAAYTLTGNWTQVVENPKDPVYLVFTDDSNPANTVWVAKTMALGIEAPSIGGTLTNDTATDKLYGGAGTDIFLLADLDGFGTVDTNDFGTISGGDNDTLALADDNLVLDLSDIAAGQIKGIETINVSATTNNRIVLGDTTLGNMGFVANEALSVTGSYGDILTLNGIWSYVGIVSGALRYADASGCYVDIDTNISLVLQGPSGSNTFAVGNPNNDSTIDAAEIPVMSGNEILTLADDNILLDLSGIADGQIQDVETIDVSSTSGNRIVLGDTTLGNMGLVANEALSVIGNSGDILTLSGTWLYVGIVDGALRYADASGCHVDIDTNISLALLGPSGSNTFTLGNPDNSGTISAAEIPVMSGNETLLIADGVTLDLTGITASQLDDVTTIRCGGAGNRIILDSASLAVLDGITIESNGTAATYSLEGSGWTLTENSGYLELSDGTYTVRVEGTMTRIAEAPDTGGTLSNLYITDELLGGDGDDIFNLTDLGNNGILDLNDFGKIDGGDGNNALTLNVDNTSIAFTGLSDEIANIHTINITGTGGNTLGLDDQILTALLTGDTLTVNGGPTDTLQLDFEDWSLDASASDSAYLVYTDGTNFLKVSTDMTYIVQGGDTGVTLAGGIGDDTLSGGIGDDTLNGGDGDDILNGGKGNNMLTGGTGADEFIWEAGDIEMGAANIITDMELGTDRLSLAGLTNQADIDAALLNTSLTVTGDGTSALIMYQGMDVSVTFNSTYSDPLTTQAEQAEFLMKVIGQL